MTNAIEIEELEWKYQHTTKFALQGVNLEVPENSFLGIVGANEQGKSTLVNCISGLIPHSYNGIYRGAVRIFGQEVKNTTGLHLAREVGLVFADPEAQFTAMTVEEELIFGLENVGYDVNKIQETLDWVCDVTMIGELLDKSPFDISGGQKQRVAIACVLAMEPRIIIMDEPTSMIDPLGKKFIFDILRKLKESGNRTIIVVEHNIEQLAPLVDNFALMHAGQIIQIAPPEEFFREPELLIQKGVYAPEVTLFTGWLQKQGWFPAAATLPRDLAGGVAAARAALEWKP